MNLKTNLSKTLDSVSSSGQAFLSLQEYLESNLSKFQQISSGSAGNIQKLAMQVHINDVESSRDVVGIFDADDVHKIVNSEISEITCILKDSGEEYTIDEDTFMKYYEDVITTSQIQSEFIGSCLSEATVTAESFTSSVLAKFQGLSPSVVNEYAKLFNVGDKLGALKAWIGQIHAGEVVQESEYIDLPSREDYTGVNVWSVVITDFLDTISGMFEKVWQGIQDLKGFFERLWNGIVKLGKYLISKAFRYLTSNLSNGESKIGVFDYPICVLHLGQLTPPSTEQGDFNFTLNDKISTSLSRFQTWCSNRTIYIRHPDNSAYVYTGSYSAQDTDESRISILIKNLLIESCTSKVFDPITGEFVRYILKPIDIAYSVGDWSICDGFTFRIGSTGNNEFYLMIYANFKQQLLDVYDDGDIFSSVATLFQAMMRDLNTSFGLPIISSWSPSYPDEWMALDPTFFLPQIITPLSSSEQGDNTPVDFASHFAFQTDADIINSSAIVSGGTVQWGDAFVWFMCHGVLMYSALMSPLADSDYVAYTDANSHVYLTAEFAKQAGYLIEEWTRVTGDSDLNITTELPIDWITCYKPYLSSKITPGSIHLQTLDERAREIEYSIIGLIVAIAATYVAIKLIRYRQNLRISTEIAQGQRDNLAWTMDPNNPEKVEQYKQLRKKARKLERISKLFGLTSKAAETAASSKLVDTVFDRTASSQVGITDDISSIRSVITGR